MLPVVLGFQTIIWLALCYLFVQGRSGSIYHPFCYYLFFHGVVFVARPILEYVFHFHIAFDYMWFYPTESQIITGLLASTLGLIAFALFGWAFDGTTPRFDRPIPDGFNAAEWRAFYIVLVLLVPIGLYSFYLDLGQGLGGAGLIQGQRDPITGIYILTNTTGYVASAEGFLIPICLMLIWASRFRIWSFIPFVAYVAIHLYIGWGRWAFILSVAMLGLLALFRKRRRWLRPSWIIIGLATFIVFQQLGQNRDYFREVLAGEPHNEDVIARNQPWVERFDGLDFANFDYLTYIIDIVPNKSDTYSYFTQYLQLFTEPIPRILWPEKPIGPPIDLVNLNAYGNFVALTDSLVGDGWISLGWLGVFITMGLAGYITVRLHRWFWRGEATSFKILTYCSFLPLTMQWFRDGGISIAKFVLFAVMPLILWQIILRLLSGNLRDPGFGGRYTARGVREAPLPDTGHPYSRQ